MAKKTGGVFLDQYLLDNIQSSCCSGDVKRNVFQQTFFFQEFSLDHSGSALCSVHQKFTGSYIQQELSLEQDISTYLSDHYQAVQTFPWINGSLPPPIAYITKKQIEYTLHTDIYSILDIRFNEGFSLEETLPVSDTANGELF